MEQKLLAVQKNVPVNKYKIRRKVLKEEIRNKRKLHYEEMFKLLNELYEVELKLQKKYTIRQLARDNDLNEAWVYRLMSWRTASSEVKMFVEEGKMSMSKACRLISRVPIFKQNELACEVIKNQMTDEEMDRFATVKYSESKQKMIEEREYKNKWNISRDLLGYCSKMTRSLVAVGQVPKNQKKEVCKQLTKLRRHINYAIHYLEK